MELFLSPNGRIDQPTYWRGILIVFAIGAVLNVISAFVSPFLGFISIVLIWPWIVLHVKRFHDSGKTGWLTIAIVVLSVIVSYILSLVVPGLFGIDQAALQAEMQREIEQAGASGNPAAAMSVAMDSTRDLAKRMIIPGTIQGALVTAIIGFAMGAINKTDPNDNKYGSGPNGSSAVAEFV